MRIDDGRQVRAARAVLGLTAQALADLAGLHKTTVLAIEAKRRIRRTPFDGNGAAAKLERVLAGRGVECTMLGGDPIVRFATGEAPPKWTKRVREAAAEQRVGTA